MHKYIYIPKTKSEVKWVKNERAAKATRPSVERLETEESLSLLAYAVIFGTTAVLIIGEWLLVMVGWGL